MENKIIVEESIIGQLYGREKTASDFLIALFKELVAEAGANWDKIEKLNHFPKMSKNLWLLCCDCIKGYESQGGTMMWVNYGCTMNDDLPDNTVTFETEKVIFK